MNSGSTHRARGKSSRGFPRGARHERDSQITWGKSLLDGVRRHAVSRVYRAVHPIFDVLFRLTTCVTHFP